MALSIAAAIQRIKSGVSDWLSPATIQQICRISGRRTQQVTLTTTLLDPVKYPTAALAELYVGWARCDLHRLAAGEGGILQVQPRGFLRHARRIEHLRADRCVRPVVTVRVSQLKDAIGHLEHTIGEG